VLTIVKLNAAHKVNMVDGDDREIIDGIKVYPAGGHTFASQYVSVRTASGIVVIASDKCTFTRIGKARAHRANFRRWTQISKPRIE